MPKIGINFAHISKVQEYLHILLLYKQKMYIYIYTIYSVSVRIIDINTI